MVFSSAKKEKNLQEPQLLKCIVCWTIKRSSCVMFKELVVLDFYIFEVINKMTYITVQKPT